ncbi:MAG: outer membrane protein transport protein [Kofleriaceae bacterium]
MKLRALPVVLLCLAGSGPVHAGGLFLPGSGATSTARAGAAVASADDGEALSINPAGLAKSSGWLNITISAAIIKYSMEFQRRGTYDTEVQSGDEQSYLGQPYAVVKNKAKPPLGIGSFQPVPVIAVTSDLKGKVPGLHVALGLYAPNSYPFRDMTNDFPLERFAEDTGIAPPASRYDVLSSESAALFPSIAAAYRILPGLDVGARFSAGNAKAKTTVTVWGTPGNVEESIRQDTLFIADVKDSFIPTFGLGATFRPTPNLEFGAVYNSSAAFRTKGTALSIKGPGVDQRREVGPIPADFDAGTRPRCRTGEEFGIGEKTPACISLQLPQNATVAARYKFLDRYGNLKGDLELDVGWENWGKTCDYTREGIRADPNCVSPGQFLVNLDAGLYVNGEFTQPIEVNFVNLGLKDTYSVRLGGSYVIPVNDGSADPAGWPSKIILRGGIAYDTRAARTSFLRASFDGAARVTTTIGAAYRTQKWELNLGGGFVYEGTNTNPGANPDGSDCNPTRSQLGCVDGGDRPLENRQGPDPTNPLLDPEFQFENPINQGTFKSHYLLFMLGFSRWF